MAYKNQMINGVLTPYTAEEITALEARDVAEGNDDAGKLERIKLNRQEKLKDTDWWVFRGNMTSAQINYRQALRDIPADYAPSDYDALLERKADGKLKHTVWTI